MSVGLLFPTIAQNVPAYVPKDGLVGWWPFNGNANDESGNGNHGTVNGATLSSDRNGNFNNSYSFDGVKDIVSIGTLKNTSRFSISFWYKREDDSEVSYPIGLGISNTGFGIGITAISSTHCNVSGNQIMANDGLTTCGNVVGKTISILNNWENIVLVCDGSSASIYVNNVLSESNFNVLGISNLIVGSRSDNQFFFKGLIDDIAVYNRILTQEEITALYTSTSPCTNPTARITPQGNTTFCQGGYVNLNATQGANYSYQWYNTGQLINGANSYFYQATAPGEYKVSIKDGACSATSNATTVIVNPLPIAKITPDGPTEFCQGGSVNLIASGGSSYKWNSGNTSAVMKVTQTGTYYVNVINSYGCSNYASYDVNVNSLPVINFVALNQFTLKNSQPVQLVATPIGGTFNGEGVSGMSFNPSVAKLGKKTITYNYTSPQGCTGSASRTTIVVDSIGNVCNVTNYDTIRTTITDTVSVLKIKVKFTTGIKANQLTTISVFPNPTSDLLLLETTEVQAFSGYKYQITDAQGKLVYNQFITAAKTEISMKSLGASGIYVLRILDGKGVSIKENKIVLAD